jgi:hypothetical protein
MTDSWTMRELRQALGDFEDDLRAAGLSENTVTTYVDRADRFLRYLSGDYRPGRQARVLVAPIPPPAGVVLATGRLQATAVGVYLSVARA